MSERRFYAVAIPAEGQAQRETVVHARSRSEAKAEAWRLHREVRPELTFERFLKAKPRVTPADAPTDDGYMHVRERYGLNPKIGQPVELPPKRPGEPPVRGRVAYPGPSSPYISADAPDLSDRPVRVHPLDVRLLPEILPERT